MSTSNAGQPPHGSTTNGSPAVPMWASQPQSQNVAAIAEFVRLLRRRWWIVALCTLAMPVGAYIASHAQRKQYEATASLLFRDPQIDQRLFKTTFLPATDPARQEATHAKLVALPEVAARAAQSPTFRERLTASEIRQAVSVSAGAGESDIVTVTAREPDPALAATVANAYAQAFIDVRRHVDSATIQRIRDLVRRKYQSLLPADQQAAQGKALGNTAQQLDILSALQTGNAEIAQRAGRPGIPVSPSPARSTILGAGLGLMLGLALALMVDRLDRRVRDPEEVEHIFGRPVLGVVPKRERDEAKASADSASTSARDLEAFRMLRANLRYFNLNRNLSSILITSPVPGDGKTTVAWSLARAAAEAGTKVLLIEADLRRPTIATCYGLDPSEGLSSLLVSDKSLADYVQAVVVNARNNEQSPKEMDVLLAGAVPPNAADLIDSQPMADLLATVHEAYDLVVIDTPPTSVVSDAIPLIPQVSGVVVVCRVGQTKRGALVHMHRQLSHMQAPTLGIVANAVAVEGGGYYGYGYVYPSERMTKATSAVEA